MIFHISDAYRKHFYAALILHLCLMILLCFESSQSQAVLTAENKNSPGIIQAAVPQEDIVKAVSVDNKKLMQTVERLKQERIQQERAQINKQKALDRQLALAKQERIKEQERIAQLKEEANKIAIQRKKQALEEKKRLKELEEKKALESKRLKELQEEKKELAKQQQLEKEKLAQEKALRIQKEKAEQEKLAKEEAVHEQLEKQRRAQALAASQARERALNQARLAGVVDKYKALILDAIGRNWIQPENVDSSLSCQFRIRLAPDGSVLDVSLSRSSGDSLLDRSAQTAIYKASPLPVPADAETFNLFRDISLTVRPEQVRG